MKKLLNPKTGNQSVDLLASASLKGDLIPSKAYKLIKKPNGKTDYLAVPIYSNIIFWHRPKEVYDASGKLVEYKKRFYGNLLQKDYADYMKLFDATKRQVKASFDLLESLGLIKRYFKNVTLRNGKILTNVMYIELIPDKLSQFFDDGVEGESSFVEDFACDIADEKDGILSAYDEPDDVEKTVINTSYENKNYLGTFYVTPPTKKCRTYTETNTKINKDILNSFIPSESKDKAERMNEDAAYRDILAENVELERLLADNPYDTDEYMEYFEIMCDLVCHNTQPIKSHGHLYPAEVVRSRILKLRREHLEHVFYVYKNYIGNITDFYRHCAATLYNSYFEATNVNNCEGNTRLYNLYAS